MHRHVVKKVVSVLEIYVEHHAYLSLQEREVETGIILVCGLPCKVLVTL